MSEYCSDLPDGMYVAEIVKMTSSKNAKGVPVVEWTLRIVGGGYDGREIPKRYHVTTDKAKDLLKREFGVLGITVENSQDFEQKKGKCIGKHIRIQATTSVEGWQSYYLKGVVNDEDAAAAEVVNGVIW